MDSPHVSLSTFVSCKRSIAKPEAVAGFDLRTHGFQKKFQILFRGQYAVTFMARKPMWMVGMLLLYMPSHVVLP